jgi:LPXTG-motif cell wall-anchored protein
VVVSPDEGLTWTIRQVPDGTSPNFDADPAVDVDEGNRAYVAYESADNRVLVATTKDRGATFAKSIDLGAPYKIKNATMPTVQAGSDGRAVVAFFGTVAEAPLFQGEDAEPENQLLSFDPDGNDPKAGWHLYVAMTYDGGKTWTTSDVTPNDPVQRGCIWWGSARGEQPVSQNCENNKRNLLDFIDVAVDKTGRVVVGWADGCVKRCVTEGHTRNTNVRYAARDMQRDADLTQQEFSELYSQEDIGVITRQSCGRGLYAAFDRAPDGPVKTCARVTGKSITAAPAKAPQAVSGLESGATSPVVAGARLPSTGGAPLLAVAGLLLLGTGVVTRRRRV